MYVSQFDQSTIGKWVCYWEYTGRLLYDDVNIVLLTSGGKRGALHCWNIIVRVIVLPSVLDLEMMHRWDG